jgi:hypothetical protein
MIWEPNQSDLLDQQNLQLIEDDPEAHKKMQAATRDTEPTIQVILLYERDGCDFLDPECTERFDATHMPDVPRIRRLLLNEVSLNDCRLVRVVGRQDVPSGWRNCGMLQAHRVVRFDSTGHATMGDYQLSYDRKVGIEYFKR